MLTFNSSKKWVAAGYFRLGVFLAEYLATLVLTLGGNGSTAQWIVSGRTSGTYLSPVLASALSTTAGVYLSVKMSGGFLNPAVTIAFAIFERRPAWTAVPGYLVAQWLGAFSGSAIVYSVYFHGIDALEGGRRTVIGVNATARIFASYPQAYMTTPTAFFDVLVASALLMIVIYALTDRHNTMYQAEVLPILFGLMSLLLGLSLGWNTGYPVNPAKDFASRVFSSIFYGGQVFSAYNNYFWIPIVSPVLGAILGASLYKSLIGFHLAHDNVQESRIPMSVSPRLSKAQSIGHGPLPLL